jgi:twitching motility protein PilT
VQQLAPFCEAIRKTDSDEIRLVVGERIHAMRHGERRDLGRHVVDPSMIQRLAAEVFPDASNEPWPRSARVHAAEEPFDVFFTNQSSGPSLVIRRAAPRSLEPPPSAPPGPRDSERPESPAMTTSDRPAPRASGFAHRASPRIDEILSHPLVARCSDIHLTPGLAPAVRVDGELRFLDPSPVRVDDVLDIVRPVWTERAERDYAQNHEVDFAYQLEGVARFRVHVFEGQSGACASMRRIQIGVTPLERLGLPAIVAELCSLRKGLVLVTGPTGSGKSTTIAGMIDHINHQRGGHVVTLEDPIEFVHVSARALIHQREIGVNTRSFKSALRAAMREDPDVVVVGEMRDFETVAMAVETAETGHLVIGALHTTSAMAAVDRIIDQFPGTQQDQIRFMLAENLKAVIAQTLCRRQGGGRAVATEIMLGVPAIANLVREKKTYQIPSVMQTSKGSGMVTMNDALVALVQRGDTTAHEARLHAPDRNAFATSLRAIGVTL